MPERGKKGGREEMSAPKAHTLCKARQTWQPTTAARALVPDMCVFRDKTGAVSCPGGHIRRGQ
jgi:hypothetical protein